MENYNPALQLVRVELSEDYRKEWNVHEQDFVCLFKNGNPISNSLYRVSGFGCDLKAKYFILIKHVEAHYSKKIMKMSKTTSDKHLEGRWVIIDPYGNEKVEFKPFESPYLKGGVIYVLDGKFYNIETGEFYCRSTEYISSRDYIFIDNKYSNNLLERGVMMINKADGSYKIIP